MIVLGFIFAGVGAYLAGLLGSSNNPVSGLTLSALIVSALMMLVVGITGTEGIAAVIGIAAIVCCMAATGCDMMQDLKVGHILGGTPWKMELGEIIGVIATALVMFVPLYILHQGDIAAGGIGFGGKELPAPQASLMAMIAKGIVGGQMAWPLIIVGIFFAIFLILIGAPAPMLIAVGMYIPLEISFAMFIGGSFKWILTIMMNRRKLSDEMRMTVDNKGILLASGYIAGEALIGLLIAALFFGGVTLPQIFTSPPVWLGIVIALILCMILIRVPLRKTE